jgi:hypothetical protein
VKYNIKFREQYDTELRVNMMTLLLGVIFSKSNTYICRGRLRLRMGARIHLFGMMPGVDKSSFVRIFHRYYL